MTKNKNIRVTHKKYNDVIMLEMFSKFFVVLSASRIRYETNVRPQLSEMF